MNHKYPKQERAMKETHIAYGSQVCRDLTGPSVPTQQYSMRYRENGRTQQYR